MKKERDEEELKRKGEKELGLVSKKVVCMMRVKVGILDRKRTP